MVFEAPRSLSPPRPPPRRAPAERFPLRRAHSPAAGAALRRRRRRVTRCGRGERQPAAGLPARGGQPHALADGHFARQLQRGPHRAHLAWARGGGGAAFVGATAVSGLWGAGHREQWEAWGSRRSVRRTGAWRCPPGLSSLRTYWLRRPPHAPGCFAAPGPVPPSSTVRGLRTPPV